MQATAAGLLDQLVLTQPVLASKPIVVHVVYASVEGGASDCPPAADGSCRASSEFDLGAIVDPDLDVDLTAQAQAYNALLLEFSARPEISGFYASGDYPMAALLDKSTSPHGKPAQDVLTFWYPKLTGPLTAHSGTWDGHERRASAARVISAGDTEHACSCGTCVVVLVWARVGSFRFANPSVPRTDLSLSAVCARERRRHGLRAIARAPPVARRRACLLRRRAAAACGRIRRARRVQRRGGAQDGAARSARHAGPRGARRRGARHARRGAGGRGARLGVRRDGPQRLGAQRARLRSAGAVRQATSRSGAGCPAWRPARAGWRRWG